MTPDEQVAADTAAAVARRSAPAIAERTVYVDANVSQIIAKYGTAETAIRTLWQDERRARIAKKRLQSEFDTFKDAAKLPTGALVLDGAKKTAYEAFLALSKTPDELTTLIKAHGELNDKVTTQEKATGIRKAARLVQFNEDALVQVAADKRLTIVLKTEKVDDKDVEVPYVQPDDSTAAPVRLTAYAKDQLGVYMPALTAAGGRTGSSARGAEGDARGTPYPTTGASSRDSADGVPTVRPPLPLRDTRVVPSKRAATP